MKDRFVWPAIGSLTVVVAIVVYQSYLADNAINRTTQAMLQADENIVSQVDSLVEAAIRLHLSQLTTPELSRFETQLDSLAVAIRVESEKLSTVQVNVRRAAESLPELVELDQLQAYYAPKLSKAVPGPIESFKTSKGNLEFSTFNFSTAEVPSTQKLAWIRIGKANSTENAEIAKAWLEEASATKVRLGYSQVYKRTRPSDYGETTEALYKRGDLYFKTSFQFQRVLETYDRYSLKYTYYVEQGSYSRRKTYDLEQRQAWQLAVVQRFL